MYIYIYRIHQCLTHVQVLSYDRRLAPSHPDPVEPAQRNLRSLRLNLEWAIKHQEEQFKMAWVTFVLQRKIEEELVANNMQLADDYGIIIHIFYISHLPTHAVIKLGLSSYPGILSRNCRLKDYQRELAPMNIGKIEAIRIYPSRAKGPGYTWICESSMEMLTCLVWKVRKFTQRSIYKKYSFSWANENNREPRNCKISRCKLSTKEERIDDQGYFICRVNWKGSLHVDLSRHSNMAQLDEHISSQKKCHMRLLALESNIIASLERMGPSMSFRIFMSIFFSILPTLATWNLSLFELHIVLRWLLVHVLHCRSQNLGDFYFVVCLHCPKNCKGCESDLCLSLWALGS